MSPFDLMRRLSEDLEQLAITPNSPSSTSALTTRGQSTDTGVSPMARRQPDIEVIERPDAVVVRADLPGLQLDDIVVVVDEGMLTISGERQVENTVQEGDVLRSEVSYGAFSRSIMLPDGVDEEHVTAQLRDGVLEVTIPLQQQQRGRRIDVQGSGSGT
jgi:HSP20 family protein